MVDRVNDVYVMLGGEHTMRTLRFIVDGDNLKQDPSCDFSGLYPGKNPSVRAEFAFSSEWDSKIKVVAFWSILDKEYEPQPLDNNNGCKITTEALKRASFKIQVLGKNRNKQTLVTNKIAVNQTGGRR